MFIFDVGIDTLLHFLLAANVVVLDFCMGLDGLIEDLIALL
jgi:hypothetical protein